MMTEHKPGTVAKVTLRKKGSAEVHEEYLAFRDGFAKRWVSSHKGGITVADHIWDIDIRPLVVLDTEDHKKGSRLYDLPGLLARPRGRRQARVRSRPTAARLRALDRRPDRGADEACSHPRAGAVGRGQGPPQGGARRSRGSESRADGRTDTSATRGPGSSTRYSCARGSVPDDLMTRAAGLAAALVTTKIAKPCGLTTDDKLDLIQDFTVYLLERMRTYDPEKGALSTYTYMIFGQWNHDRKTAYLQKLMNETPLNPLPELKAGKGHSAESDLALVADWHGVKAKADHRVSERAERLLEMVPAQGRELVRTHLAYGASLTATAEIHGVSDRTVLRWTNRAKEVWREEAA